MTDPITTLFGAFDVSTLQSNIVTLLTTGVVIAVVYAAYRHVKRGGRMI